MSFDGRLGFSSLLHRLALIGFSEGEGFDILQPSGIFRELDRSLRKPGQKRFTFCAFPGFIVSSGFFRFDFIRVLRRYGTRRARKTESVFDRRPSRPGCFGREIAEGQFRQF